MSGRRERKKPSVVLLLVMFAGVWMYRFGFVYLLPKADVGGGERG